MKEPDRTATPLDYGLLALLGILWGIPYALTKISLTTIPPLSGVAARVALAALALWVVVLLSKAKLPTSKNFIPRLFVQGCISCVLPYSLIALGQKSVDSSLAAILNSTTPLFVCVISLLWTQHESLSPARLFGVSAGFAGVILIAGASSLSGLGQNTLGQAAIILATVSSAVGAIQGRRFADVSPEFAAAGTLTFAALVLVPLSFIVESPLQTAPSAPAVAALLVNALIATALRFVIYFHLIKTVGSMGTTSVGYLKPAVGVLIGCTFMGESLTWTGIVGLLAILVGVTAINRKQQLRISVATFSRTEAPAAPTG